MLRTSFRLLSTKHDNLDDGKWVLQKHCGSFPSARTQQQWTQRTPSVLTELSKQKRSRPRRANKTVTANHMTTYYPCAVPQKKLSAASLCRYRFRFFPWYAEKKVERAFVLKSCRHDTATQHEETIDPSALAAFC